MELIRTEALDIFKGYDKGKLYYTLLPSEVFRGEEGEELEGLDNLDFSKYCNKLRDLLQDAIDTSNNTPLELDISILDVNIDPYKGFVVECEVEFEPDEVMAKLMYNAKELKGYLGNSDEEFQKFLHNYYHSYNEGKEETQIKGINFLLDMEDVPVTFISDVLNIDIKEVEE